MKPLNAKLVTAGCAAVLAVYSAGYARTRSSAERFALDDRRREPAPIDTSHAVTTDTTPAVHLDTSAAAIAPIKKHADTAAHPTIAPTVAAPDTTTASAPPPPAPAPPPPAPVAVQPPVVDSPALSQPKERAPWKDGMYTGWGTSRHGDIEATVQIQNGRIISASISQCLTRYPCSRISNLVPQVAARQSADVDYVSGATQSSNAFYAAVLEALSKAK